MVVRILAIGGGTGSGKSTVAKAIREALGEENCRIIRHDDYYQPPHDLTGEQLKAYNYDHPTALETDRLVVHLDRLKHGISVEVPKYDFAKHARKPDTTELIDPHPFIIVEGILVLHEQRIRNLADRLIFVDTPAEVRLERRIERDVRERGRTRESVTLQWNATVHPMHLEFCEPSKRYAGLVIPEGGANSQANQAIQLLVETLLKEAV